MQASLITEQEPLWQQQRAGDEQNTLQIIHKGRKCVAQVLEALFNQPLLMALYEAMPQA